ncbi:MAG: hypothetical protein JJT90_12225 [Ectothiorhodospiraceae bacterium]|nr:hypothetical protein [Ectothiorhodospiraceae bacterium]
MTGEAEESGTRGAGGQIHTGGYVITRGEGVVNYHFPVTVEIRTATAEVNADDLVEQALNRLAEGMEAG